MPGALGILRALPGLATLPLSWDLLLPLPCLSEIHPLLLSAVSPCQVQAVAAGRDRAVMRQPPRLGQILSMCSALPLLPALLLRALTLP